MKIFGNMMIIVGLTIMGIFGYEIYNNIESQNQSLNEVENRIENERSKSDEVDINPPDNFSVDDHEAFGILEIPRLDRSLPIIEGTDPDALEKGVGRLSDSVFPGQDEQILLSGHRDTVFHDFDELQIGDQFIVNMSYGEFEYEIQETEIVPEDDTSVIGDMGEEVLVVTTCYPFNFVGSAPDRFVAYAYPVEN